MQEIRISREQYESMLAHVRACLPEEACGLLGGLGGNVLQVIPVTNQAHSAVRYFMDPLELLAALEVLEEQNQDIVGIFHSHPAGPPYPSQTDIREFLYEGSATLIWSPKADGWQLKAFMIEGQNVRPLGLIVD